VSARSSRPLRPAPAAAPVLPSLASAWRALSVPAAIASLAVAGTAQADATVPRPKQPPPKPVPQERTPPRSGERPVAPRPKRPDPPPPLDGDIAHARLPDGKRLAELLLHPHGPDEPCRRARKEPT
jgi:hypothetical protein